MVYRVFKVDILRREVSGYDVSSISMERRDFLDCRAMMATARLFDGDESALKERYSRRPQKTV